MTLVGIGLYCKSVALLNVLRSSNQRAFLCYTQDTEQLSRACDCFMARQMKERITSLLLFRVWILGDSFLTLMI
jgi:hypothetical protein